MQRATHMATANAAWAYLSHHHFKNHVNVSISEKSLGFVVSFFLFFFSFSHTVSLLCDYYVWSQISIMSDTVIHFYKYIWRPISKVITLLNHDMKYINSGREWIKVFLKFFFLCREENDLDQEMPLLWCPESRESVSYITKITD